MSWNYAWQERKKTNFSAIFTVSSYCKVLSLANWLLWGNKQITVIWSGEYEDILRSKLDCFFMIPHNQWSAAAVLSDFIKIKDSFYCFHFIFITAEASLWSVSRPKKKKFIKKVWNTWKTFDYIETFAKHFFKFIKLQKVNGPQRTACLAMG